jgi:uncharacterized membrane protein
MEFLKRLFYDLTQVHPLHTMVVHFPIALTGAALFFILIALGKRGKGLEPVAFANLALASVSTLVAGLTGLRDNAQFWGNAAPNVQYKIALAITLFLVTAGVSILRWRKPDLFERRATRVWYVLAYFVSFALASVLGFLGGVILYGF